jgi:prepilin-type processing-associated H-X9-DG protein
LGPAATRADDSRARSIAAFLDNDVIGVVRIDLTKVDVEKIARRLAADPEQAAELSQAVSPWFAALRTAGSKDLYFLINLADTMNPEHASPSVIVPLAPGVDARGIGQFLCGGASTKGPIAWPTCATVNNAVFAGSKEALERVRQLKPVDRPELTSALAALGDTSAEVVLIPTSDTRRVVEELLPSLPKELGGGPISTVTRGLRWIAAGLSTEPEPGFQFIVQGSDAASAQALAAIGKSIVQFLRQSPSVPRYAPNFAQLADEVKAIVDQDRITVSLDAQKAATFATALLKPMREAAARRQCVNNLKQIGLAMHNYHSTHGAFPPAYTVDKDGKPLLSWRVLILPFLEQESLYKEFHLDEPWDSPHNKPLIDRMPATYLCQSESDKRVDHGKTTYLTPRGKATIFPGSEGIKIQKITDGTSNTIFTVDAPGSRAVTWTKPDDWDVEQNADLKQIFGRHPGGTNFGFADGSVRFFKDTLDLKTLQKLVTCDGGEVLSSDELSQ